MKKRLLKGHNIVELTVAMIVICLIMIISVPVALNKRQETPNISPDLIISKEAVQKKREMSVPEQPAPQQQPAINLSDKMVCEIIGIIRDENDNSQNNVTESPDINNNMVDNSGLPAIDTSQTLDTQEMINAARSDNKGLCLIADM